MSNNIYLHIPEPCHEDWNKMTAVQQGRFCDSCSKQVVDFTNMTDGQVLNILQKASGKTCGRFTDDQLTRPLQQPYAPLIPKHNYKYIYHLMVTSLLTIGNGWAQPRQGKVAASTCQKPQQTGDTIITPKPPVTDPQLTLSVKGEVRHITVGMLMAPIRVKEQLITGRVEDENKQPLSKATVTVKGTRLMAITDDKGRFELYASNSIKEISLLVAKAGYAPRSLKTKEHANIKVMLQSRIKLSPQTALMGDVQVMPAPEKPQPIEGTVLDAEGSPIVNAAVRVKNPVMTFVTDSRGRFSFTLPPEVSSIEMNISSIGYLGRDTTFDVINMDHQKGIQVQLQQLRMGEVATIDEMLSCRVGGLRIVRPVTPKEKMDTLIKKAFRNELFSIQPNPVQIGQEITLIFKRPGKYEVQLFDNQGRFFDNREVTIEQKKQGYSFIPPATLAAGVYYIRATGINVKKTFVDKLVVQ
jgi:hypothetical protein